VTTDTLGAMPLPSVALWDIRGTVVLTMRTLGRTPEEQQHLHTAILERAERLNMAPGISHYRPYQQQQQQQFVGAMTGGGSGSQEEEQPANSCEEKAL
jgi:hypothetical protein